MKSSLIFQTPLVKKVTHVFASILIAGALVVSSSAFAGAYADAAQNDIAPLGDPAPTISIDSGSGANGDSASVGDDITWSINWVNNATAAADVNIADVLPASVDFVSATDNGTCSNGKVEWTLANQAAGATGTVYVKARINAKALVVDSIANAATVDPGTGVDVATNTLEVPVDPGKGITSGNGAMGSPVRVNDSVTYTIRYVNNTDSAAAIHISDTLPTQIDFEEASDGGAFSHSTVEWALDNVAAHTNGYVTVKVKVNESAMSIDSITQQATVDVPGSTPVTVVTENPVGSSKVQVNSYNIPEVSPVAVGDDIAWAIKWVNNATTTADVNITDVLPASVDFVSATDNGTCSNGTVKWTLANQAAGATGKVYVKAKVNATAILVGSISNTATVDAAGGDTQTTNTAQSNLDASIAKAVSDGKQRLGNEARAEVGKDLTYTIGYVNDTNTASDITITDTLPTGLTYKSNTQALGTGGSQPSSTSTEESGRVVWTISNVGAHEGGTVTIVVTVNSDALQVNSVDNTASVAVGNNQAVDTNTTSTMVNKPTSNNLLVKKTVTGTPKTPGTFDFTMAGEGDDTPMPADAVGSVVTRTLLGAGEVEMGEVVYYASGTYTYTINEVEGTQDYAYDDAVYEMTVEVTDDGSGQLTAAQSLTKDSLAYAGNTADFTNAYEPPATPSDPKSPSVDPDDSSALANTGDNGIPRLLISLLCLSATGFGVALCACRKRSWRPTIQGSIKMHD